MLFVAAWSHQHLNLKKHQGDDVGIQFSWFNHNDMGIINRIIATLTWVTDFNSSSTTFVENKSSSELNLWTADAQYCRFYIFLSKCQNYSMTDKKWAAALADNSVQVNHYQRLLTHCRHVFTFSFDVLLVSYSTCFLTHWLYKLCDRTITSNIHSTVYLQKWIDSNEIRILSTQA